MIFILAIAIDLYFFNLTAFHWWASSGPPSPHPEFHMKWGNIFFWVSICIFIFAVLWLWLTRKEKDSA
jgi:hypothetical protein